MSRVPRHRTLSCFLLLALLFVSGTFVAGLEETTQRTLRATLLGDAVAETLLEMDRVSASGGDSAASLASSSLGQILLTEEKKLVDEMVVVVAGRKEGGRRRLGAQELVNPTVRTSGRCTDGGAGWAYLTTKAACEEGAGAVGWSDVTVIPVQIRAFLGVASLVILSTSIRTRSPQHHARPLTSASAPSSVNLAPTKIRQVRHPAKHVQPILTALLKLQVVTTMPPAVQQEHVLVGQQLAKVLRRR